MAASSKYWILTLGVVVSAGGAIWFFAAGGSLAPEYGREIGLLVFQVGLGILVVEGVLGYALGRDKKSRASSSLAEVVAFADAFDERVLRLVVDAGALEEEPDRDGGDSAFTSRFPYPGRFDRESLVPFNDWLAARSQHAIEECRSAAHFLPPEDVEAVRAPLRLLAPIQLQLTELAAPSKQRTADGWAVAMLALDGISTALNKAREQCRRLMRK